MFVTAICLAIVIEAICATQEILQRTAVSSGGYHDARQERSFAIAASVAWLWRRVARNLDDEGRNVSGHGVVEGVAREPEGVPIEVANSWKGDELPDPSLIRNVWPLVFDQMRLEVLPKGFRITIRMEILVQIRPVRSD
jgi:hypothetical protein